jgi:hypothetical protein
VWKITSNRLELPKSADVDIQHSATLFTPDYTEHAVYNFTYHYSSATRLEAHLIPFLSVLAALFALNVMIMV